MRTSMSAKSVVLTAPRSMQCSQETQVGVVRGTDHLVSDVATLAATHPQFQYGNRFGHSNISLDRRRSGAPVCYRSEVPRRCS